ncbi:bola protein [Rhexocercosporidium sp. MPI-PUGE-AT-0058]|nr:bola protein [Rhexocercosporidium sp. MPI-PUGE-AT-0058]
MPPRFATYCSQLNRRQSIHPFHTTESYENEPNRTISKEGSSTAQQRMDRAATASLRRCLRSGGALRCATSMTRSRCVATAICPARSVATTSIPTSTLPKTGRQPTSLPNAHTSLRREYSTPSTSSSSTPQDSTTAAAESPEPPAHLNPKERQIWEMLMRELQCTSLEVQDISGGCGSMYGIDIVSERFRGLGMLKQQRLVNQVLGEEIKGWHGVQLKTRAPEG